MKDFLADSTYGVKSLENYQSYLNSSASATTKFSSATATLKAGLKNLGGTLLSGLVNFGTSLAISTAISLAIKGIDELINHQDNLIKKGEEAQSEIKKAYDDYSSTTNTITELSEKYADQTTEINSTADAVTNLATRYSELHKGVGSDNSNISLSNSQYEEYLDISNQLATTLPYLCNGLDSNGNALINLGNSAGVASEKLKQVLEDEKTLANVTIGDNINDSFKGSFAQSEKYEKQKAPYQKDSDVGKSVKDSYKKDIKEFESQLDKGYIEFDAKKLGTDVALKYQEKIAKKMKELKIGFENYQLDSGIDPETGQIVEGNFGFTAITGSTEQIKKLKQELSSLGTEFSSVNYEADKELRALELKQKDTWTSFINDSVKPYLETSSALTDIPVELTNAVENNLSNIDWSKLYTQYDGDAKEMLNEQFVLPLQNLDESAQEALTNALKIDPSKMSIDEYESAINDALSTVSKDSKEQKKWKDLFFQNQLDEATEKADQLKKKFSDNKEEIDKLSGEDRELAYSVAFDSDEFNGTYNDLISKIKELKDEAEKPVEFNTQTFLVEAQNALAQIDSLNAAIANSFSGKGLNASFETSDDGSITLSGDIQNIISAYKDLEGYDPSTLFEKTANGVHVNQQALRELQSQLESKTKANWLEDEKNLTSQLAEATKDLNDAKLSGNESDITTAQETVDSLQSQLETVQLLSSAYEGATSAYQKWLNAQSAGEEGDMYRNVSETMRERGESLYEEGRYNTNEFRAIANYYSDEDLSTAPVEKLVEAYQNAQPYVEKFFTGNKEGLDNFLISLKEVSDSEGLNWIEDLGDGKLKFNFDDEEVAKKFHLSTEAIQALVRGMQEYMDVQVGTTNGVQDFDQSIDEMRSKADEAKQHLEELNSDGNINLDFNFNSTDLDDLNSQIDRAKLNLEQFRGEDGTLDINADGCNDAITILQTLIQQKQLVSQPEIMTVDTSGLDDSVANAVSKLQEYQNALNELNTLNQLQEVGVPVDDSQITEAQSKVDNLFSEIQGMSQNGELKINADVSVDSSSQENLQASLNSMTPEIKAKIAPNTDDVSSSLSGATGGTVSATVNYTKGTQDPPDDRNAKVNYTKGQQYKPEKKEAKVDYTRGSQENPKSPVDATVNYSLGTVAKPPEVTVKVNYDTSGQPHSFNGTANALGSTGLIGTAKSSGDWSVKKSETSLVGELGTETVVRNGKFFTVGDNGAEFVSLRAGDIVFNHKQTKELFENGHVTSNGGRARLIGESYAFGSAYSSGSPWKLGNIGNGNISSPTSYSSTKKKKSSSSNSSSSSSGSSSKSSSDSSSSSADDASEKVIDWIEILLSRVKRITDLAVDSIDRAIGLIDKQTKAADAISKVQAEIGANQEAAQAYLDKMKTIDLSDVYKEKIKNGELSIETITDETLQKNIEDYQSYYESYLSAMDNVLDLEDQLTELAEKRLSIIEDQYDAIGDLKEAIKSGQEENRTLLENLGTSINSDANKNSIKQSITTQLQLYSSLTKKLEEYEAEVASQLKSGLMKKGSEQWYNAQKNIQEFATNITKASSELIELQDALRQVQYDVLQYSIDSFDRKSNKMSAYIDLLDAQDRQVPESLYQQQIKLNNNKIAKQYNLRAKYKKEQDKYDVNSKRYQELAEKINDADVEILNLRKDNESLKDSIYELRFANIDKAIQKYSDLEDELSNFRDLLNDDAFVDKKGAITDEGLANIALLSQSLGNAKQKIADYTTGLTKLYQTYKNGVISADEYNEKAQEYRQGIQEATKDVKSYQDSLKDLYLKSMHTEVDYLDKIIEKRKSALQAKAEYYDYDKKIKSQTKDINSLKAQIAALEGVKLLHL